MFLVALLTTLILSNGFSIKARIPMLDAIWIQLHYLLPFVVLIAQP
jgi:hypothetical protein